MPNSSDVIKLSSFPATPFQALAFLYVQNQDLTDKSPKEILGIYKSALAEIEEENRKLRNSQ